MLKAESVTRASFSRYGYVLDNNGESRVINGGKSKKWDFLVPAETFPSRRLNIGLISTSPSPAEVPYIEKHILTDQLFYPLRPARYCVIVADPGCAEPVEKDLRAFVFDGQIGVCYKKGTWHSPIVCLDGEVPFLTMMRSASRKDLTLHHFATPVSITFTNTNMEES